MQTRVIVAAGFITLAIAVMLAGFFVFEAQRLWPTAYAQPFSMPDPGDLMDGVDKPVGMLFSLTLGLFVLAGFVLRGLEPRQRASRFVIFTCAGFLLGSMLSIYMGFMARNVALYFTSFQTASAISLAGTFIALQLLGVALSALSAILLLADYLLGKSDEGQSARRGRRTRTA
jgi:hypothetical protein